MGRSVGKGKAKRLSGLLAFSFSSFFDFLLCAVKQHGAAFLQAKLWGEGGACLSFLLFLFRE
jgi:hypothetical protein